MEAAEEHSITSGHEISEPFIAAREGIGMRSDHDRRHVIQRVPARAEILHVAMVAGYHDQPRLMIPLREQTAEHRVKAFEDFYSARERAAMTDAIAQPVRMEGKVVFAGQARQQTPRLASAIIRQAGYV